MKHWSVRRLRVVAIALAVLLLGVATWWWRARGGSAMAYTTMPVKRGDLSATISATGTIEPVEAVDVGAQVAGRITTLGVDRDGKTVDYGSTVAEGAVLVTIDDSVYAADLAVANAQMERSKAGVLSADANLHLARAKLHQAEADWNRAGELGRKQLLSPSDLDAARAAFEVANSNVAVAEAAVAQVRASTVEAQAAVEKAQRNLAFCTIRSPVNGVVIDRRVNIGQTVVASLNAPSLFLIARDLTKMQIWAAVNEADVGRIKPGTLVTFTVDAFPGHAFQGAVGKVRFNATMTQNVVLYTVEINIDNPDKLLLPYLTASLRFVLNHETNALLVPNAALRWSPSSLAQIAPDWRTNNLNDPPPNDPPAKPPGGTKPARRTIWLRDGAFVRPIEVAAGTSDGANTAVLAEGLSEGQEVVTGETVASAQTDVKNPFLPKAIRR